MIVVLNNKFPKQFSSLTKLLYTMKVTASLKVELYIYVGIIYRFEKTI